MANLDMTFIKSTLRTTSFNLSASDFTSTKYKKEIQYLFNMHFFPNFDLDRTIDGIDKDKLNNLIASLKSENKEMFRQLHNYNLKGIGPGEVTLYFLVNNCKLGGGSSAGLDVIVGSKGYEVKGVNVTTDGMAIDFKLGGTVPLAEIINDLNKLRERLGISGAKSEIPVTVIRTMKEKAPKEFNEIEKKYAKTAYDDYFKNHDIIFINNSKSTKVGNIEAIKQVGLNDIFIERVTGGTIKPKIKL
jgi:hypothetical protein